MARPKKEKKALTELSKMLYEDLIKAGDKPQQALTKVIKAVSPLMRQ